MLKIAVIISLAMSAAACTKLPLMESEEIVSYSMTAINMTDEEVADYYLEMDDWGGGHPSFLVKKGRSTYGSIERPWPKVVRLQWRMKGGVIWHGLTSAMPSRPLPPSGKPSSAAGIGVFIFNDRAKVYATAMSGGVFDMERDVREEVMAERAAGIAGAPIVEDPSIAIEAAKEARRLAAAQRDKAAGQQKSSQPLPPLPACKDIDACVRLGILENSAFVEACGIVAPEFKKGMAQVFVDWPVLKLPIPGLREALRPDNPDRAALLAHVLPYLGRIPSFEVAIECSGRYSDMKNPVPTLKTDAASLPENVLKRYQAVAKQ